MAGTSSPAVVNTQLDIDPATEAAHRRGGAGGKADVDVAVKAARAAL